MNGRFLFPIAVAIAAAPATAEDYLLRVETIESIDRPDGEPDQPPTVIRSVEVVARPGAAFCGRSDVGGEKQTFEGRLNRPDGGRFKVRLRYAYEKPTDDWFFNKDGGREPGTDTMSTQSTATLPLNGEFIVSGMITTRTNSGNDSRTTSELSIRVSLSKYEPLEELRTRSESPQIEPEPRSQQPTARVGSHATEAADRK